MGYSATSNGMRGFVWSTSRGMQNIGTLRPTEVSVLPWGINNAGVIVGESACRGEVPLGKKMPAAFLYAGGKMTSLTSLIDPALCRDFSPQAINDFGQIVGQGRNSAGRPHAFLLTPIP